jgi:hypothetical protein
MTDDTKRFKEIKADHEARVFTRQSLEQHRGELIAMVERLRAERDHYVAHHNSFRLRARIEQLVADAEIREGAIRNAQAVRAELIEMVERRVSRDDFDTALWKIVPTLNSLYEKAVQERDTWLDIAHRMLSNLIRDNIEYNGDEVSYAKQVTKYTNSLRARIEQIEGVVKATVDRWEKSPDGLCRECGHPHLMAYQIEKLGDTLDNTESEEA